MITEDQLEQLCLDWFKAIGYDYVCGYDIAPDGDQPDAKCHYHGESFYSCRVNRYAENNKIKRINWFGMREDIPKGIELDTDITHRKKFLRDIGYKR